MGRKLIYILGSWFSPASRVAPVCQESASPVEVGLLRASRVVPQPDHFAQPRQDARIVQEWLPIVVGVVTANRAILIAVDPNSVGRLLDLPWLEADASADLRQEQVHRLLERVAAMVASKEDEVADPSHQIWLLSCGD